MILPRACCSSQRRFFAIRPQATGRFVGSTRRAGRLVERGRRSLTDDMSQLLTLREHMESRMDTEARTSGRRTTVNRAETRCERTADRGRRDAGVVGVRRGGVAPSLASSSRGGVVTGRPPARRSPVPPGGDASRTACASLASTVGRSVRGTDRVVPACRHAPSKGR